MTFKCNPYHVLPSVATLPRGLVQLVEQLNNDSNIRGLNPCDAGTSLKSQKDHKLERFFLASLSTLVQSLRFGMGKIEILAVAVSFMYFLFLV
jgi:hypothetical protein